MRLATASERTSRFRAGGRLIRPDIAFTKRRVAVFIDGCFWHACPMHGQIPTSNRDFWTEKLAANAARDRQQTLVLSSAGWCVVRLWEHETVDDGIEAIMQALRPDLGLP